MTGGDLKLRHFADTFAIERRAYERGREFGTDRERRRIRRAQSKLIGEVRAVLRKFDYGEVRDAAVALIYIDAATRSRKGKAR